MCGSDSNDNDGPIFWIKDNALPFKAFGFWWQNADATNPYSYAYYGDQALDGTWTYDSYTPFPLNDFRDESFAVFDGTP